MDELSQLHKDIILSLAKNDMNISKVARDMKYHRNSILYHMDKIKRETGLNPYKFYDLMTLVFIICNC